MMKEDEKGLARAMLAASGEGVAVGFFGEQWWASRCYPPKRFYSLLAKWERKGWWEYGVSLRGGWLTDAGRAALAVATSPT
jgi:hypothetical protein